MRFQSAVLLAVVIPLLLVLGSSSAAINSKLARRATESYKTANRLLRPGNTDGESRVANRLPAVEVVIKAAAPKLTTANKLQLQWWLMQNKRSVKVLKKLNLGDSVDDLLTNPKLSILQHYISMFNQKNPKKSVTMAETLASKYGEVQVTKMLELAKTSSTSSERTKTLATELQLEQLTVWLHQKLPPAQVYKNLQLDDPTISHQFWRFGLAI
ncbi:secreted RxLR effector peptide protein, putative [Phytophthora infestans T30-4]|uniref:Secreted RxLR effector peptide protein n=2 Tax=Phytophthora infestans TaxID=4787 RepID=A0A8S9TQB2_PHYIN